ncbi:acid protease [Rickenella mellea]|uniref:Acid protease n=1 Tax=Rickenella mellea TaxID=50990 RepID=A0A4Y7PWM0_9AGAM|nr:acid protease [Rickenella mellea]
MANHGKHLAVHPDPGVGSFDDDIHRAETLFYRAKRLDEKNGHATSGAQQTHGGHVDDEGFTARVPINPVLHRGPRIDMETGEPGKQQQWTVVPDTGSAFTWVGAKPPKTHKDSGHPQTSKFKGTKNVKLEYGTGDCEVDIVDDKVVIGLSSAANAHIEIPSQTLGAMTKSSPHFNEMDGILGIGDASLTDDLTDKGEIPTVIDNYFKANPTLPKKHLGIYFCPVDLNKGHITIGDSEEYDHAHPTASILRSPIHWVPRATKYPAKYYHGLDLQVSYDNIPLGKAAVATGATPKFDKLTGITDTGTTGILMHNDIVKAYLKNFGFSQDQATGYYIVTDAVYATMKSLFFHLLDASGTEIAKLEFVPNAQVMCKSRQSMIAGHKTGHRYLLMKDFHNKFPGLDFLLGYSFLQRFYTVIDHSKSPHPLGFAETEHTHDSIH